MGEGFTGEGVKPLLLTGAKAIADYIGIQPRALKRKVEEEGFPAFKDTDRQWKALDTEILAWYARKRREWATEKLGNGGC